MQYYINTGFGISYECNANMTINSIFSVYQDVIDTQIQSFIITVTIQKVHKSQAVGTSIQNLSGTIKQTRSFNSYVSDTSMLHINTRPEIDINALIETVQQDVNMWNSTLILSSGKLCPKNSQHYTICWKS